MDDICTLVCFIRWRAKFLSIVSFVLFACTEGVPLTCVAVRTGGRASVFCGYFFPPCEWNLGQKIVVVLVWGAERRIIIPHVVYI
jgi:hypothetical protein